MLKLVDAVIVVAQLGMEAQHQMADEMEVQVQVGLLVFVVLALFML